MSEILREAKWLYKLGWGVHWIKPNSKAPVKAGWADGTRDDWATLKREYREGYGLGVRLGAASKVDGGYLANVDIDLKSGELRHWTEALGFVAKAFPELGALGLENVPWVKTGYGRRIFVLTKEPAQSGKLGASNEETVVKMPTAEINRRQLAAVKEGKITEAELKAGFRVRPAWEVEFMSAGKQVVLPPSIHPDTGKPYTWGCPLELGELVAVQVEGVRKDRGRPIGSTAVYNFKPVPVDLGRLPSVVYHQLKDGTSVEDRSAACFGVAIAMLRSGYNDAEILTALTDKDNYLGETAYDHRGTSSRAQAAAWVRDYCLRKAKAEVDSSRVFEAEVEVSPTLETEAEIAAQVKELTEGSSSPEAWKRKIKRTGDGDGPPKPSLSNVVLILTNAVAPEVFKRDTFAGRDFYGCNAPWEGGKAGKALDDDDIVNIKAWLANRWGFEPAVSVVYEAATVIATRNSFHPVREELERLPEWDGVDRIDTWLARHFGAKGPPEYLAQVFRKWLVASVTRVYEPGAKFDWMPILEGGQGTGKSVFGAILFGQAYFTDWLPNLADKDAALGLMGKRCVEFGELDSLRRNEVETIKAFVTRQVDNVRPPYGRKSVEIYRQCVFYGTTNRAEYFRDETGNRRFNPVEVGRLDFAALRRDRCQLWAEALFIYRNRLEGSLYLDNGADEHARSIQAQKMVVDVDDSMVGDLMDWLEAEQVKPQAERFPLEKFKLSSLFRGMGPLARWNEDSKHMVYASKALRQLGAHRRMVNGSAFWGFSSPPRK